MQSHFSPGNIPTPFSTSSSVGFWEMPSKITYFNFFSFISSSSSLRSPLARIFGPVTINTLWNPLSRTASGSFFTAPDPLSIFGERHGSAAIKSFAPAWYTLQYFFIKTDFTFAFISHLPFSWILWFVFCHTPALKSINSFYIKEIFLMFLFTCI